MLIRTLFFFSIVLCCGMNSHAQDLSKSIERSGQFLKNAQLESGAIQDSSNALFSTWETILVTDALLDNFSAKDTTIQKALAWLRSIENEERLICHNAKCKTSYCIETSALYFRMLGRIEPEKELTERLQKIEKLKETNGSWKVGNPDVKENLDYPSVTAFVLNLFDTLHYSIANKDLSISFLLDKQTSEGSWGQNWEYYNTPAYALWQVLPALKSNNLSLAAFEKGKQFILNTQLENGSWDFQDESSKNQITPQLETALMVSCLINENDNKSIASIHKAIAFLLQSQKENGSWDGGFFPIPNERYKKREYLFATALTHKVLLNYQKRTAND